MNYGRREVKMSKTPESDAASEVFFDKGMTEWVPLEVARKLEKDRNHWKANHADMVQRCKILQDRPDLPVDRTKAYKEIVKLQEKIKELTKE